MTLILAIATPFKLDDVRDAPDVAVSGVKGLGRQNGRTEIYREVEYQVRLLRGANIEMVVGGDTVDGFAVIAKSRGFGDGEVCVRDAEETMHIRTGEIGAVAL